VKGRTAKRIRQKSAVERLTAQLADYDLLVGKVKEELKTARNHKDKGLEAAQLELLAHTEKKRGLCKDTIDNTNRKLKAYTA
jgi:hypothetical protein